jgi:transcriptional regulator with XRE-family HTH domain
MTTIKSRLNQLSAGRKRGWKADLARACGVKPASVSDWVSGKTAKLDHENIVAAAKFFGVETEWLANGRGPKFANEKEDIGTPVAHAAALDVSATLASLGSLLSSASPAQRDVIAGLLTGLAKDPSNPSYLKALGSLLDFPQL